MIDNNETIRCFIKTLRDPSWGPMRYAYSPLVMMRGLRLLLHRLALKEVLFLAVLSARVRASWILALHLHAFFGAQLRQMPNEQNQLPAIIGFRAVPAAECRHPREAN